MTAKQELNEKGLEAYRCYNCTTLFVDVIDAPYLTCPFCYKITDNPSLTEVVE